jgi:hypothetical protein
LIVASLASLTAAVLPHELARYAAVPMGIALIVLGLTLVAQQRQTTISASARLAESVAAR